MIMLNKAVHTTPVDEVNDPPAERPNKWWNRSLRKQTWWKSFTRVRWGPLALRTAAACARHNYIMRCTLARIQRTCGARDPVNTRVPMGTSNEMVVTVSHPAKVVARRDVHAGGCAPLSLEGMIRVHRTPHGFCQHQQYATARWTNVDENGPVGTKVLAKVMLLNVNEGAWRLRTNISFF